jgi:hypothetical protein
MCSQQSFAKKTLLLLLLVSLAHCTDVVLETGALPLNSFAFEHILTNHVVAIQDSTLYKFGFRNVSGDNLDEIFQKNLQSSEEITVLSINLHREIEVFGKWVGTSFTFYKLIFI